jgi:hypothetical protein
MLRHSHNISHGLERDFQPPRVVARAIIQLSHRGCKFNHYGAGGKSGHCSESAKPNAFLPKPQGSFRAALLTSLSFSEPWDPLDEVEKASTCDKYIALHCTCTRYLIQFVLFHRKDVVHRGYVAT